MKFSDRVKSYLIEKEVNRGHKALATRLSKDLNKDISAKEVEEYLDYKENTEAFKDIKKQAKDARDPEDYEWGAKYKILKRHFEDE